MEETFVAPVKEKLSVEFIHLPSYAEFILHHELENFVAELLGLYEKIDIPLLRFFKAMPPDQRKALSMASNREMLTLLASNRGRQYIEQSISNWLTNQLPLISRDQVLSQDISLANYVRRRVLRQFLSRFTKDSDLLLNILEEIDRFTVVLDSELFSSFLKLQQEQINVMNSTLQKREKELLEAQAIAQIGSFEWDFKGKQSSFTPEMFKIFEMEGPGTLDSFLDNVHPDEREKVRQALDRAFLSGDYECEYRYVKGKKEKIIYSRGKVQFEDGKPVRMAGTVSDVTERNHIIKKLQESEKLHKQAQALTHIGNWSWVVNENKITWSDEMYRIYGLEPQSEEISYERFLSFIIPEDHENRIAEINMSLETLQVQEYHFTITTPKGEAKVLRGKGEIVADQHNKPLIMLGTCQDVTREFMLTRELKEREKYLRQLNQSLEITNEELNRKNQELESFNFIASHDLQEPLRKIQIYSNRIIEKGGEFPAPLHEYFDKINQASNRMQKLIEDFLSFSQTFRNAQVIEEVDLNELIEEIKTELNTRMEEKQATLKASLLPKILSVRFQVKQLLTNLIGNSLKYTNPGIPPSITIDGKIVKASEISFEDAHHSKEYVRISVADNGIGFDEKYTVKIFELFQRLHNKEAYSGTGIGLALCKKIVQNLNGYIWAESKPGKGSVFYFFIPQNQI